MVEWGVEAGTTSSLCVGGRRREVLGFGSDTLAHAHSVRQPARHSVRQTKRSSIRQEDSTLPGDGASYPCIASGGPKEVGAPGLGGFVSAAEHPSTNTCKHPGY